MSAFFSLFIFVFTLANCTIGTYVEGTLHTISSKPLSLNNPELRTCVFEPHYRIVHFPMYHTPPTGHYTPEIYEEVAQSQFQLLHTIRDYNRSRWQLHVFDENIASDGYNRSYLQSLSSGQITSEYKRLDGQVFLLEERLQRAKQLFQNNFPTYYEHLSKPQKDFLFNTGASLTLYFLGEIPQIHKVISPEKFNLVKANLRDPSGLINTAGKNYWLYDFREEELKREVLGFYQRNYSHNIIILIAYGANHDFSNEFAGLPFQSGHRFCLNWSSHPRRTRSILP